MHRKGILIFIGLFLATLPISYIMNGLVNLGLPISDALVRLGVYWVTAAEIAYISSTILTSLFITLIAWLALKTERNSKVQTRV